MLSIGLLCFMVVASSALPQKLPTTVTSEVDITPLKYDRYGDDRFDRYDRYDDLLDLPSPVEIREALRDIFPKATEKIRLVDAIDQLPDKLSAKVVVLVPVKVLGKNPRVSKSVLRKLVDVAVKNAKEDAENKKMANDDDDDDDDDEIDIFLKPPTENTNKPATPHPVVVVNNYDDDSKKYYNHHHRYPKKPTVSTDDTTVIVSDNDVVDVDNFVNVVPSVPKKNFFLKKSVNTYKPKKSVVVVDNDDDDDTPRKYHKRYYKKPTVTDTTVVVGDNDLFDGDNFDDFVPSVYKTPTVVTHHQRKGPKAIIKKNSKTLVFPKDNRQLYNKSIRKHPSRSGINFTF